MDATALASALVASQQAQVSAVAAAKLMKMNAAAAMQLVDAVQKSADNLKALVAEGVGQILDVTA